MLINSSNTSTTKDSLKHNGVVYFALLLSGLLFSPLSIAAQEEAKQLTRQPYLVQFSMKDGLPSNQVYDIESDASGQLYFATQRGIAQFDGYSFTSYSTQNELAGNVVFGFHRDQQNRLWYYTFENRLGYLKNGSWHHHPGNKVLSEAMSGKVISSIAVDTNNTVWIGYKETSAGMMRLDEQGNISRHFLSKMDSLMVYKPFADQEVWTIGSGSAIQIEQQNGQSIKTNKNIKYFGQLVLFQAEESFRIVADSIVYKLQEQQWVEVYKAEAPLHFYKWDSVAKIEWLGTRNGGLIGLSNEQLAYHLLPDCSIYDVHRDHEGGLWISTATKGVFYWSPDEPYYYPFSDTANYKQMFIHDERLILSQNKEVEEWIPNGNNWQLQTKLELPKIISLHLLDSNLLITTVSHYWVMRLEPHLAIEGEKREGMFYAAASYGTRRYFGYFGWTERDNEWEEVQAKEETFSQRTFSLLPEAERLLIGNSKGIWSFADSAHQQLVSTVDSLVSMRILKICPADSGYLLITSGQGIVWWNGQAIPDQILKHLPTHPFVHRILPISSSSFYLLSSKGLELLQWHNNAWEVSQQPLRAGNLRAWLDMDLRNQSVWLLHPEGLFVHPIQKNVSSIVPGPVEMVSLSSSNGVLPVEGHSYSFPYNENDLRCTFRTISYAYREQLRYKYRINGGPWKPLLQRVLQLANLAPNTYLLEVKVSVENSKEANIEQWTITVHPPIWQSSWFLILVGALLLGLTYLLSSFRQRQRNRVLAAELQRQKAQLQVVQARINPHFLFNVFNSIQLMVVNNTPREASRHLSRFAKLMREVMRYAGEEWITLEQEVEFLKLYLDLENLRLDPPLTYQIRVAPNLTKASVQLPPLLVQVLVENAVWHGIRHLKTPGEIQIDFAETNDQLVCTITDNGIGLLAAHKIQNRFQSSHRSNGLELIKSKLRLLEKQAAKPEGWLSLSLENATANPPQGTTVILTLPHNESH